MASAREFKSGGAGRGYPDALVPAHREYRRRDSPEVLDPQTELTRIAVMLRNQVDQTRTLLADIRQTSQRYKDYAGQTRMLQGLQQDDGTEDDSESERTFSRPRRQPVMPFKQSLDLSRDALEKAEIVVESVPGLVMRFKEVRDIDESGMRKAQQFNKDLLWIELPLTRKCTLAFTSQWPLGWWDRTGYILTTVLALLAFTVLLATSAYFAYFFVWPSLHWMSDWALRVWKWILPWLKRLGMFFLDLDAPTLVTD